MIDASCTQWEDDCGTKGSCWVYDSAGMSMRLFVLALVLKVLSIFFNVLALCVYKPPKNDEEHAAGEMNNLTDNANNNSSTNLRSDTSRTQIIPPSSQSEVGHHTTNMPLVDVK